MHFKLRNERILDEIFVSVYIPQAYAISASAIGEGTAKAQVFAEQADATH